MKIHEGFMLREVAGNYIVMPVGDAANRLNGMIKLNGTSAFLFRALEKGTDEESLVAALLAEYDVDADTARRDVAAFLDAMRAARALDE
jgi:hypothetical protein